VCDIERDREREKEIVCACIKEGATARELVCVSVCVCVCVCLYTLSQVHVLGAFENVFKRKRVCVSVRVLFERESV